MRVVNLRRPIMGKYVRVDRASVFGNPFVIGKDGDRSEVIAKYREYFLNRVAEDDYFRARVLELDGQNLACWCAPQDCHADVIIGWLDAL